MRVVLGIVLATLAMFVVTVGPDYARIAFWATEQQRAFQNEIATAVRALKTGDALAWLALLGAAGAYGFVHAVGPGHGKYLIGGVGLGSAVTAPRLVGLALASSLAQALWAIILVYGGFSILELSAPRMTLIAEDYLAPASYLAIAAIGLILIWRAVQGLRRQMASSHSSSKTQAHGHGHCGCGHAHGPSVEQVERVGSLRDAVALILSIAIRPCTGAIFLLVIAWQMDLKAAGAAAVIVMGVGTGLLTSLVAVSSVLARVLALASSKNIRSLRTAAPVLQMAAGLFVVWFSVALLRVAVA